MNPDPRSTAQRTPLSELARLFLRLGVTGFGGPAAHIAMMHDEVVRRRAWLGEREFLDLIAATNLIPGPNSTELAIHIGWARRRWAGLAVAGACFIVPAALITGLLAWAYVRWGTLPTARWLLYGIKPVMLAVVVQAIARLAPAAARTTALRVLGALAAIAVVCGVHELVVLFGTGAIAALAGDRTSASIRRTGAALLFAPALPVAVATTASALTLGGLFGVFLKIGSVLFGSGYVLLAFLRADLVQRLGWLSESQLLDAIAAGQVTPGPVLSTATFIGYVLQGPAGALLATLGIFLPAFLFVAISGPLVPRLRASPLAGHLLDGVQVASLALMLVVTVELGRAAVVDVTTAALVLVAMLLLRHRLNASGLVLLGAAAGWLLH